MDDAAKAEARRRSNLWAVAIIVVFVALVAMCMPSSPEPTAEDFAKMEAAAIAITADDLTAAWRENEVAASVRFEGKPVRVTGLIAATGLNEVGQPYLALGSQAGVVAVLARNAKPEVANLAPGQEATVVCTDMLHNERGVRLDGCTLR